MSLCKVQNAQIFDMLDQVMVACMHPGSFPARLLPCTLGQGFK